VPTIDGTALNRVLSMSSITHLVIAALTSPENKQPPRRKVLNVDSFGSNINILLIIACKVHFYDGYLPYAVLYNILHKHNLHL
jgi:hypothetical protein